MKLYSAMLLVWAVVLSYGSGCNNATPPQCPPLTIKDSVPNSDGYTIQKVSLLEHCLLLNVSFGGGCNDTDDFELYWNGAVAESWPLQVNFVLWHDDHDDPCDAIEQRWLAFDISPIAEGYASGAAYVSIQGYNEAVLYEW